MSPRPSPPADASLEQAVWWGVDRNRQPTAAHPACNCREHDHGLDRCLGPEFTYRLADGSEVQGDCRILGGVDPATREACPMHGSRR